MIIVYSRQRHHSIRVWLTSVFLVLDRHVLIGFSSLFLLRFPFLLMVASAVLYYPFASFPFLSYSVLTLPALDIASISALKSVYLVFKLWSRLID